MAILGTKLPFTAVYTDALGNPATVQGDAVCAVADPAGAEVVDLVQTGTGCTGAVKGLAIGPGQLQVTADADRGEGVRSLTLTGDFEFTQGEAVSGGIVFGDPVPA